MRCKPGELAIIVRSRPYRKWGLGRVVRVVELAPSYMFDEGPAWRLETPIVSPWGEEYGHVLDSFLRPIRPDAEPEIVKHETEQTA